MTYPRLLLSTILALLVACAQETTRPPFRAGQVWTLSGSGQDRDARIIVLAVREDPNVGTIVHVRVENLRQDWPEMGTAPRTVTYLPFAKRALESSVGECIDHRSVEPSAGWESEWERTQAVIVAPVAETLDRRCKQLEAATGLFLEQPLPAYLPRHPDPEDNSREEGVARISLQIVCDVPGTEKTISSDGRPRHVLEGHEVHYELLGQRHDDIDSLKQALDLLAAAPRDQKWRFVVEPGEKAVFGDVALVVDALQVAGFHDVTFGRAGSGKEDTKK